MSRGSTVRAHIAVGLLWHAPIAHLAANTGHMARRFTLHAEMLAPTAACLVFLVAIVSFIQDWPHSDGDAAIYWVFARSMWSDGFFHYGASGPSHGATSPLWALLLSVVGLGQAEPINAWKLAAIISWGLACLAAFRLARWVTQSSLVAWITLTLMVLYPELRHDAIATYETNFFVFVVTEALLATLRLQEVPRHQRVWQWAGLLAVLPLARPEGMIVAVILGAAAMWLTRQTLLFGAIGAIAAVPVLVFHLWMWRQTGLLIPSSVTARQLLSAMRDSYLSPANPLRIIAQCVGIVFQAPSRAGLVSAGIQGLALLCGVIALVTRRDRRAFLIVAAFLIAVFCALLIENNPGFLLQRYASLLAPIGFLLMATGVVAAYRSAIVVGSTPVRAFIVTALTVAVLVIIGQPARTLVRHATRAAIYVDALDRAGALRLAPFLTPSDTVLVYEVQTAYFLPAKTASADGVVGGAVLPYLQSRAFDKFIRQQGITHVLTSRAYRYRSAFRGTLLEQLTTRAPDISDGDTVQIDGLAFQKLATFPRPPGDAHWTAAYRVIPPVDQKD